MNLNTPVKIGNFVIYCEKFKSSGVKNFSEQNTVSGEEIIANSGKKAVRIIFSGRICSENPLEFLPEINNMMYSNENLNIEFKDIIFSKCRVQSFVVDDENKGYVSAVITLLALEVLAKGTGES